jgi:lantibiotic modifying enzyme
MSAIFGQQHLAEQGLAILKGSPVSFDLEHSPSAMHRSEILSGSAGVIPVLLKLHGTYGHRFLLDTALHHGERLLQSAHRGEKGWSWASAETQPYDNLTGFSHGTSGVAWALLELHNKNPDKNNDARFLHAAQEAFRYERSWYNPEQENWPDFRYVPQLGSPAYLTAWCNGAGGIGMSRIRAYQLLGDHLCRSEAEIAVKTTTRLSAEALSNNQGNYSLCHGYCGNAELLLYAGEVFGDERAIQWVHHMAEDALRKFGAENTPWRCGTQNYEETPDLMLGLAGIGHFYLRLHDRQRVPSVLLVGPD